ncbi:GvpL/GvpF family gas vesicle protein [soil metagenome]
MSDVIYLYGFVPPAAPEPPPSLLGVGGIAPQRLPAGPVCAIVGRLPANEYATAAVETRLEDLAWVGEQGLAHERVVLWFVDHAEILPARLFSMYKDDAALQATVAAQGERIAAQLTALAGRREWNLKVAFDSAELGRHGAEVSAELRALDGEIDGAPPGRRYLLQRKRADVLKREVGRSARRLAAELLDSLRSHAEDVRMLPLAAGDDTGNVVLSAALLVGREAEPALREEAERRIEAQRRLGMIPNLSGPWAPYRFLEPDDDA